MNDDKETCAFLLAHMCTAFAIDHEGTTVEDVTHSHEIVEMIRKGKLVSRHLLANYLYITFSSKL
jgi:hypothetical protein